jgi:uncharacterized protein (UPF0218 family)
MLASMVASSPIAVGDVVVQNSRRSSVVGVLDVILQTRRNKLVRRRNRGRFKG